MFRTRIKICGIRDSSAAEAAADAGADAVGLVFVADSPRCVTVEVAREIVRALPAFVEPVGLFVDAPAQRIRETAAEVGLRVVQLHGREQPGDVAALDRLRIIRAVAFDPSQLAAAVRPWQRNRLPNLAAVLFDTPPPADPESAALTGGSGKPFDWHALAEERRTGELKGLPPLMLAGGLSSANVAEAIAIVRPYAVDVSSGVESSRGVKDTARIHAFCDAVRAADAERSGSPLRSDRA